MGEAATLERSGAAGMAVRWDAGTGWAPRAPILPVLSSQTLWFHIVTSSLVLKHHEMLDMLLQKSLIVFIDSACRTAAARSSPRRGHTGTLP